MKILYLHGFNSSSKSNTGKQLPNAIKPSYSFTDADKTYFFLNQLIVKENIDLLIGSSLGGFWSNYFSEKYDIPCILINPCINPNETLKQFLGFNKSFAGDSYYFSITDIRKFEKYKTTNQTHADKIILLGKNDELINYKSTEAFFKNRKIQLSEDKHQYTSYDKLHDAIKNIDTSDIQIGLTEESFDYKYDPTLLTETFINVFDAADKAKYIDDVWNILNKSYADIGGLKGRGFESKQDVIDNIKMWKLYKKDNKIVSIALYKDKNGRKLVAGGTDGSLIGKIGFKAIVDDELKTKRSYSEISGKIITFMKSNPKFKYAIIPFDKISDILGEVVERPEANDKEVINNPDLKDYFYTRNIGGSMITKLMIQKPNIPFYN